MVAFDGGCVYSCRHSIWGGDGTCVSVQADPIGHKCSCGEGYMSRDSLGSPSCVRKRALVPFYVAVVVFGAVAIGFLLWTATKQRRLSLRAQASRRARLRLRLIYSASVWAGSTMVFFLVAAAFGNLYGSGMLQALYCVSMPLILIAAVDLLEVWIGTLPSQLLPADSVVIEVMKLADEKRVFVWVGRGSSGGLAAFGISAFLVLDARTVVRCINLTTSGSAACVIVCFSFVGFHLTGIINNAKRQASPSAHAFYDGAIRTLRIQVAALSAAAVVWMAAVAALEPHLGGAAARTPIIPLSIMMLDGYAGFCLAVHFAKVGSGKGAPASPGSTSPIASRIKAAGAKLSNAGAKVGGSVFGGKSVAASTTTVVVSSRATLPRPGGNRVVPTASVA